MGPYTVTNGVVEGEPTVTLSQPTLRLANLGNLDICTIITAPVDAELNVSADTLYLQPEECNQPPENMEGVMARVITAAAVPAAIRMVILA